MNAAEKIRLALMGNKESRTILARDSNRMVQLAVISNPKISESEVTLIAASRYTDEEVFRRIAASREWMRLHQVRLALVNNPRCPLPIAGKLIETLGLSGLETDSQQQIRSVCYPRSGKTVEQQKIVKG